MSVKTLRFDSRARNRCLPLILASSHDCNLHRTVTRAGTDAPQVAICKSRWAPKRLSFGRLASGIRVISVWFYLYSPPSDLSVCEGARKLIPTMSIAQIFRMVEQ